MPLRTGSTSWRKLLIDLVDDEPRRRSMGAAGRHRVEQELAWSHQAPRYLGVYERLLGRAGTSSANLYRSDPVKVQTGVVSPTPAENVRPGGRWRVADYARQRAWATQQVRVSGRRHSLRTPRPGAGPQSHYPAGAASWPTRSSLPCRGALDQVPGDAGRR